MRHTNNCLSRKANSFIYFVRIKGGIFKYGVYTCFVMFDCIVSYPNRQAKHLPRCFYETPNKRKQDAVPTTNSMVSVKYSVSEDDAQVKVQVDII